MKIYLLRHGETAYNVDYRYQGVTDIPLSPAGLAALKQADFSPKTVFVTPLKRTKQTAEILFPTAEYIPVNDLGEMNFGVFEGRNYKEMEHDSAYRAWVDSNCESTCPGGECKADFSERVCKAFESLLNQSIQNSAALTAKDLSFAYDEEKVILSHAETQVHTDEIVALTGENGSGKSTLTKLLIGFYTPTGGEVELKIGNKTVHGAEIRNYLSYDSGFVSVFAGTLKENICMDQPFDEKKFRKAVELANLTEFVNEKTADYEIEPEGKNLSSGQRRKVALARIFYDDRPVFVLDEPTANLDKASAEGMFEALKQVCKDKICIIVTHDAFISEKCDRVLHLNNKKVTG